MTTRHPRRRTLDIGGFRAVKIGLPSPVSDLYYAIMEMSWGRFVALVSLSFVLINMAFGSLYALLPGAIANMAPRSLIDGFFFSVETLGTVGYGTMAPATHLGHAVAATEILVGLFFSATMTGLIFARFARPRTSFAFSRVAVITHRFDRPRLLIRVASTRLRPIADVTAQLSWLRRVELEDGRFFRQLVELPLIRAHNPTLTLMWILVHEIEPDSEMMAALEGDGEFRLTVTVSGIDTLLATQALGGEANGRKDILIGHEFDDMIDEGHEMLEFDFTKLHDAHAHRL
jgi:inward rectifier potassium channel